MATAYSQVCSAPSRNKRRLFLTPEGQGGLGDPGKWMIQGGRAEQLDDGGRTEQTRATGRWYTEHRC